VEREPKETKLILCIDLDADPITGSLTVVEGSGRRFSGWIGLSAAIAAVRSEQSGGRSAARSAGAADEGGPA
jgi:hypothetical protein